MFWLFSMIFIWVVALACVLGFVWHAKRVNERFDRDAATYFEQLWKHAESRGLENIFSDTRPSFMETEMLTSRTKAAKALGQNSGAIEGGQHGRI